MKAQKQGLNVHSITSVGVQIFDSRLTNYKNKKKTTNFISTTMDHGVSMVPSSGTAEAY